MVDVRDIFLLAGRGVDETCRRHTLLIDVGIRSNLSMMSLSQHSSAYEFTSFLVPLKY